MIDQQVEVPTADGQVTTFITYPERGGPHPLVLFYMDAPGIREELRDMARRIASVGYYVMLPNLYYRSGVMELGRLSPDPESPERKRMFELMESLSIPKIMSDTDALIAYAAKDGAKNHADTGTIGCVGYCMSGQYAINAAARYPDRVRAAASIYGVRLLTDSADSPHKVAAKAKGEIYFACAEIDRWMPMNQVEPLRTALREGEVNAEVEVYPGVEHGFAFPARPVYHKPSAERHWERLFALFRRNLGR